MLKNIKESVKQKGPSKEAAQRLIADECLHARRL